MKEQLIRQIIAKQDELLNIYSDYVIGNECEGFDWAKDFRNPANKCIAELAALKKQLKQAEAEVTEYELETLKLTPIPSGWICPRCQKVHSWLDMTCDCEPKTIISTTIIAADRNCNNCKNWYKSGDKSPCNNCINYNNWA